MANQVEIVPSSILLAMSSSLEYLLDRFWSIEESDPPKIDITEDGQCETVVMNGMRRDKKGRHLVPLQFHQTDPIGDL